MHLLLILQQGTGRVLALALGATLSGCGNMSGLDGASEYGCKAPAGVQCQSVSGTYYNAIRGTKRLPSGGADANRRALLPMQGADAPGSTPLAMPLRSAPRILRMWIKPWEDAEHDLVDQSYVYVRIDAGQWQLDHVQRKVREAYAPLRAPVLQATSAPVASAAILAPKAVAAAPGKVEADGAAAQPAAEAPAADTADGNR
ncbi:TraV family lipoprotein [Massilia sp. BJB1822]|uniref:TraV family lipoprotein n=1 Tax=Massilia sp. BJB1822 TaxID=2744470 RepID=UPI001592B2AD|nr:TraV family lipoprotein [Massilia sp. BJB1822]NVD97702.1 TraV family lipoprotein [Massilia sp. BJB1822]